MANDLLAAGVLTLLATYLLHSTLLLGAVALLVVCYRPESHALQEQLWKSAAVIPLLTAPLQLACGLGMPVLDAEWNAPDGPGLAEAEMAGIKAPAAEPEFADVRSGFEMAVRGEPPRDDRLDTSAPDAPADRDRKALADLPSPPSTESVPVEPLAAVPPADQPVVESMPARAAATEETAGDSRPALMPQPGGMEPPTLPRYFHWLAGLAVCVVTAGLLRVLLTSVTFHRRLTRYRLVQSGPLHGILVRLARRAKLSRPVQLLECDELSEPIAFGLRRWTIAVPCGLAEKIDELELEALLAHELAHLIRGDAWWLHAGRLLCGCLPFQPLNFLARARWRQAAEFQCDDWAADCTNNPLVLANCLTNIAQWRLDAANCPPALPAGGSESTLTPRVERLLAERPTADPWTRGSRRLGLALIALVVTTVLSLHGPRGMLRAESPSDPVTPGQSHPMDETADNLLSGKDLELLDAELRQAEKDLRRVDTLVRQGDPSPEVKALATRLSARLADLRRHRRELFARVEAESFRLDQTGE